VVLLAAVDAAHEDLLGPAGRHILQREFSIFGKTEYQRLAGTSVSHLYNLRRSVGYKNQRIAVHHTQARRVSIAERRKPDPRGHLFSLRRSTRSFVEISSMRNRQLSLASAGRLATTRLGRAASADSLASASGASVCNFGGALLPLVAGATLPAIAGYYRVYCGLGLVRNDDRLFGSRESGGQWD
jgi:hypothetical protein